MFLQVPFKKDPESTIFSQTEITRDVKGKIGCKQFAKPGKRFIEVAKGVYFNGAAKQYRLVKIFAGLSEFLCRTFCFQKLVFIHYMVAFLI